MAKPVKAAAAPADRPRRRRAAAKKPIPAAASTAARRVTVRHYCQGIGDCHLLQFPKADGSPFWMLIDCGVHSSVSGGSDKMDQVVADIAKLTSRLDVVVVTHEHTDHVSGFRTAAEHFKNITVGEVWLAWTENPNDAQARELDMYKRQALAALQLASARLDRTAALGPGMAALRSGLDAVIGFNFGAKGDRVRAQRDAAVAMAKDGVRYIEPTDPPLVLGDVPNLRIFPLGPPRDAALLGLTERASEMYGDAHPASRMARAIAAAFAADGDASGYDDCGPFEPFLGSDLALLSASHPPAPNQNANPDPTAEFARDHYFGPSKQAGRVIRSRPAAKVDPVEYDQSWRRIDHDWLGISADLAMQLDKKTNNTSLVLAFEFTDTRRVLLFAADAQVGNWLSWHDRTWALADKAEVTGPDLMARSVYYKVGHHGSHNATLRAKGLELMSNPDLSAFIPTNQDDAKKVGWGQMPFGGILDALAARCNGRVIRADDKWLKGQGAPAFAPSGSIIAVRPGPGGLWVEVDLA